MNHERVPASYWLHAHGSSKASTAWRDVGWQSRQRNALKSPKVPMYRREGGDPKHVAGERAGGRRGAIPHQSIPQAGAPSRDHVAENAALVRSRPLMSSYVLSLFERTV